MVRLQWYWGKFYMKVLGEIWAKSNCLWVLQRSVSWWKACFYFVLVNNKVDFYISDLIGTFIMKVEEEIKLQPSASWQVFIWPSLFSLMFPIALKFLYSKKKKKLGRLYWIDEDFLKRRVGEGGWNPPKKTQLLYNFLI